LAGKPARDDIDGNSIGSKSCCGKISNIFIARHLWPVVRKHTAGKRLDLAKRNGFKAARSFKAQRKPAKLNA
jgi:hypothetical protein